MILEIKYFRNQYGTGQAYRDDDDDDDVDDDDDDDDAESREGSNVEFANEEVEHEQEEEPQTANTSNQGSGLSFEDLEGEIEAVYAEYDEIVSTGLKKSRDYLKVYTLRLDSDSNGTTIARYLRRIYDQLPGGRKRIYIRIGSLLLRQRPFPERPYVSLFYASSNTEILHFWFSNRRQLEKFCSVLEGIDLGDYAIENELIDLEKSNIIYLQPAYAEIYCYIYDS